MPIEIPSSQTAPVFAPKSDYEIVKYMDLTKFLSLLQRKALFFCRLDMLEDKFEGTTSKANFNLRYKWYQTGTSLTDEEIRTRIKEYDEFSEKYKALACINCWNKYNTESVALWKIYSDFNKGIMIKSSINKLKSSLEQTKENIQLSEIRYINYQSDLMPDGNSNFPIIHKQKAYTYEEEVRLIHTKIPEFGWVWDWESEEVKEGVYISVDLNKLIEDIVISPYAPKWYFKLIQDIIIKYDIQKNIKKSELSLN